MNYHWSWGVFLEEAPDGVNSYLGAIILGTGWTLALSLCAWAISLVLGSGLGIARTSRSGIWRIVGATHVEIFRNIPLIVQMFLWYFVLPEILPSGIGAAIKHMQQPWSSFVPALLCLGCYGSARVAEHVRAGIQSLPPGQFQAGIALGLTRAQCYRYVVLPRAFRIILPPLTSEFMATIKYSSVALTIGLLELTGEARAMQEFSFHIFEAFSAATVIYLVINNLVVLGMRLLERRLALSPREPSRAILAE